MSPARAPRTPPKIVPPRLDAVVRRAHLWRRLDGSRDRRIVWVSGHPGAGKTTLVASWVQARGLPCAWIQLDSGDDDPAGFFHYLALAARRVAPRARLPTFSPEYLPALGAFARRFLRALAEKARAPFALVLDDCHDLPRESPMWDALREGLPELAPHSAVLVSRGEPPPALARLRLIGALEVVAADELKLTRAEAGALARLRGKRLPASTVDRLHAAAAGWAAGLVLLLAGDGEQGPKGRPQLLFDYFAGEILGRAGEAARRVLLETALLPRLPASLAVRLTGIPAAAGVLAELAERGTLVARSDGRDPVYRTHPLFREFLLEVADAELPAERRRELRREAGRLLAERGEIEDAVEILCRAGEWEAMAALVVRHAHELAREGRAATLARWIAELPPALVDRDPWLLFWSGATRLPRTPEEARSLLERAFEAFEAAGDVPGLYLAWAAIVDATFLAWNGFRALDRWIAAFDDLRRRHPPPPEIEDRAAVAIFTALYYRRPDHPDLPRWEERILPLALGRHDPQLGRTAYALAEYWFSQGDLTRAGLLLEAMHRNSAAADPLTRLGWRVSEGHLLFLRGDAPDALRVCQAALEDAAALGVHVWDGPIHALAAMTCLHTGDLDAAAEHLRRMASVTDLRQPLHAAHLHHMEWMLAARRGQTAVERREAEAALRGAEEAGMPTARAFCEIGMAAALVHAGEPGAAEPHLARAERQALAQRSLRIERWAALVRAAAAEARGDAPALVEALRRALGIVRRTGLSDLLWESPATMARWCAVLLREGIEVEAVRQLVTRRGLVPGEEALGLAAWPWPVRVRAPAVGGLEIERDGEPVRFARKVQKKPLELLRALADSGGELSRERAEEGLWPDAEGDAAHRALDTTLHRLRKLLGRDDAVQLREGMLRLDRRVVFLERQPRDRRGPAR